MAGTSPAAASPPVASASIAARVSAARAVTFRYIRSFGSGNGMQLLVGAVNAHE